MTSGESILHRSPAGERWTRLGRLWAFSFGLLVVWSRLSVILHEAAGHALVWWMGGGRVSRIEVSLFGGGNVLVEAVPRSGCPLFLFRMSGIFVNAVLGLLLAVFCRRNLSRRGRSAEWRPARGVWLSHVLALGTVVNVAGATHYTALGAFYGFGDPAPYRWLWGPALVLLILGVPVTFCLWAKTLLPLLGGEAVSAAFSSAVPPGPPLRLGWAGVLVAVVPLGAYAGGMALEGRSFAALRADREVLARAIARKREEKLRDWRAQHGAQPPPRAVREVATSEIARPFPLTVVVLLLDALFLGAALLWPARPGARPPEENLPEAVCVPWLAPLVAAALVLAVCRLVF